MQRVARRFGGALALVTCLGAASSADALDELGWFGGHAAYYDEFRKGAIGLNAHTTFGTSPISVGAKADFVFRPDRITWVFDVDLQYDVYEWKRGIAWVGAAAGVLRDDIDGPIEADLDPLVSAFVGFGLKQGPLLPYAEIRLSSSERVNWVYYIGLRF